MASDFEVFANYLSRQGEQEVRSLELMCGAMGAIGQLFSSSRESEYRMSIERERAENELEVQRREQEIRMAEVSLERERIDLEKHRITEQKRLLEKIVDASLAAYNGKLDSLTKARSEYTAFYEKQLSDVNSTLNELLAQRDRMDIDGYSKLTPTINRLIESKENFISKYNVFMIEVNGQISKLELKFEDIMKHKTIEEQ